MARTGRYLTVLVAAVSAAGCAWAALLLARSADPAVAAGPAVLMFALAAAACVAGRAPVQ